MSFPTFGTPEALLERLATGPRECVFLLGAPLVSAEGANEPGVPTVVEVVTLLLETLRLPPETTESIRSAASINPPEAYQRAFELCYSRRGPDIANSVIRKAVLRARTPGVDTKELLEAAEHPTRFAEACYRLQELHEGWHLRESVEALGRLLLFRPQRFGGTVLTPNFDPLIETSISRQFGSYYSTVLHSDGSLSASRGTGCHVVHLHGLWFGSDTLHLPHQLKQERPQLKRSLIRLLENKTLVVAAYGGWDDIMLSALAELASDVDAAPDILWTFFEADGSRILASQERLIRILQPGINRCRVALYAGVDVHELIPALYRRLQLAPHVAHVPPVPDDEMIAMKLGSAWALDDGQLTFGLVFATQETARRAFQLFLAWSFGAFDADNEHIVLSITKEALDRYTYLIYPGQRGVPEAWKQHISQQLSGEANPTVTLLTPYFWTHADYWERPGMKELVERINDGDPVLLNTFYKKGTSILPTRKRSIRLSGVRVATREAVKAAQLEHLVRWRDPFEGVDASERKKYEPLFRAYSEPRPVQSKEPGRVATHKRRKKRTRRKPG